jgi:uncharacterized membrane protein YhdT
VASLTEFLTVVWVLGSLLVAFVAGVARGWVGFFTWWVAALLCSPPVALLGLGVMMLHTINRRLERVEEDLRSRPPRQAATPVAPGTPLVP